MIRSAVRLLVWAIAVGAIAGAAGYVYVRQSLPRIEGEVRVSGLGAPVEILRDRHGIPHIFAGSLHDAQFALGYVHAQDRLWQMEMNRRLGSGRLAEVVGPAGLETDRFVRTLRLRAVAEANELHFTDETRALLAAYAGGVNAFLAGKPVLPPEFWLLRVTPERWTTVDSAVWAKMMAWDLGGNWRNELLRMRLGRTLPSARVGEFLPPYPGDAPVELPDLRKLYGPRESGESGTAALPHDDSAGLGSNSWVIAGARSASGKPLMANDPHLGLAAPSVWYFAHLHAPGANVIGATLPGVPGILLGRNEHIAWSFTNTGSDVQDLYLEKLDPAGGYVTPDGARAFGTAAETIKVRGGDDEMLNVRWSRHGPVISDVSPSALEAMPRGHALALAWTALADDDLTLQSALNLQRAVDWPSFLRAARDLHAPQQNVSYADVEGNIGFIAAGRVPVRKAENLLRGLAPVPGWDARYDWDGYVPFDALPRQWNPATGIIVTANHKIVPPDYPHLLTFEWQPPYRARRIDELLAATPAHDQSSFTRMQLDQISLAARELLPRMLAIQGASAEAQQVLKWLAAWDGSMAANRIEPLLYSAWLRELTRAVYADELGSAFRSSWSTRAVFLSAVLAGRGGQEQWCDDVRTERLETCDEVLTASLETALAALRRRYGADPQAWSWGEAHAAAMRHRPLSRQPTLRRFFDISVPTGGDDYTINVGRMDFADEGAPFANRHAASLRAIYDLSNPQSSVFIHSGGQSGNPLSGHYKSFTSAWQRGEYVAMVTDRRRLEAEGVKRLVLLPAN